MMKKKLVTLSIIPFLVSSCSFFLYEAKPHHIEEQRVFVNVYKNNARINPAIDKEQSWNSDPVGNIYLELAELPIEFFLSDKKEYEIKRQDGEKVLINLNSMNGYVAERFNFIKYQVILYNNAYVMAASHNLAGAINEAKKVNPKFFPYKDKLNQLDKDIQRWYKRQFLDAYNFANTGNFQQAIADMYKISQKSPYYSQAVAKINEWKNILNAKGIKINGLAFAAEPTVMEPYFAYTANPDFNTVETGNVPVNSSELEIARNLHKQRNYHKAIVAYRKAAEMPQYMVDAAHELGRVYYDMENMAEAIGWFKKALEYQPENITFLSDIARAYHAAGETELAVYNYNKVIGKKPSDGLSHYYLGNIYTDGNVPKAIFEYKLACDLKVKEACEALQSFK